MRRQFAEKVDFLLVYIAEAHADDEWPIGSDLVFNQPKTLEDRQKIIMEFFQKTEFEWPCLMDNEKNEFDEIYSAWPLRFYIIDNYGRLPLIAEPQDGGYYELPKIERAIQTEIEKH